MTVDILANVRARHIKLMGKTLETLGSVLKRATHAELTTLTDGEGGWTVTEVVCHLRDFDVIFHQRAERIVNEDFPMLQAYDHLQMSIDHDYKHQDPFEAYARLVQSRRQFIAFFESLTPEGWERAGTHPESGYFSLTHSVMQVGHHDADHLEQITRILADPTA